VIQDAWSRQGGVVSALRAVKEKINRCGVDLHAWGATRTHPNTERIKEL